MSKPTIKNLLMALGTFLFCILIGSAITLKLTEPNTALNYLWFSSLVSLIAFSLLLTKYKSGKTKLTEQFSYFAFFIFCMVWFMLSLFMPIFFMQTINLKVKIILGALSCFIVCSNFSLGYKEVKKKWVATGSTAFDQEYKKSGKEADWEKVANKLNINFVIHIPGIPKQFIDIISVLLIIFMIIGLNLRSAMPVFSVFSWGIPATVFAGCFAQIMGTYFSLRKLIQIFELKNSVIIRSAGTE